MKQFITLFLLISCMSRLYGQNELLIPFEKDGLWGYMDTLKRVVIQPKYSNARPFHKGLGSVMVQNTEQSKRYLHNSLIINQGEKILLEGFIDGANYLKGCGFEFVNKNIYFLRHFEDYTRLEKYDNNGQLIYEFYNTKGERLSKESCLELNVYPKSYIYKQNDRYGIKDMVSEEICPPIYHSIKRFGSSYIVKSDSLYGLIDRLGKMVLPIKYAEIAKFFTIDGCIWSIRYAIINKNGKQGVIGYDGSIIVEPLYDEITPSSINGYTVLERGKFCEIADTSFKTILRVKADKLTESESKNHFLKTKKGKVGLIDLAGKQVIPCRYEELAILSKEVIRIRLDEKYGLIDYSNNILLSPKYEEIRISKSGKYLIVKQGGKYGGLDMNGNKVLSVDYELVKSIGANIMSYGKERNIGFLFLDSGVKTEMIYDRGSVKKGFLEVSRLNIDESGNLYYSHALFDSLGATVLPFNFSYIISLYLSRDLIIAKTLDEDLYGMYNLKGKLVLPHRYKKIKVKNGRLYLERDIETSLGKRVEVTTRDIESRKEKTAVFDKVRSNSGIASHGFIRVGINGKYGLVNMDLDILMPLEYDAILDQYYYYERLIKIRKNGEDGYFDIKTGKDYFRD